LRLGLLLTTKADLLNSSVAATLSFMAEIEVFSSAAPVIGKPEIGCITKKHKKL
jgi:hypothetical protein